MQFKRQQRELARANWGPESWFYQNLGQPARDIVGRAYGILSCSPREKARSQEYLTLSLSLFARKIGAEKSHVVHAVLTGSLSGLMSAICRREGANVSSKELAAAWEASFREVSRGP